MNRRMSIIVRLLCLLALLLSSAVVLAQDEAAQATSDIPFMGIRYTGDEAGLLVTGVIANTPAAEAELLAGDVVTAVEDEAIQVDTVREVVWKHAPGTTVALSLLREGEGLRKDLTLMARPEDLFENEKYAMPLDLASLGLFIHECQGRILVMGALAGSEVAAAGFQLHDHIVKIDGDAVSSYGQADIAVSDLAVGDVVSFVLRRNGTEMIIKVIAEDHRRRPPRQRPRPRPRLEFDSVYNSGGIDLGYGDGFIAIKALSHDHDLYVAGLRQHDFITGANGAPIAEAKDLFADDQIKLTVQRANGSLSFDVPASVAPLLLFGQEMPVAQDASQWLDLHEKQVTLGVRFLQLEPDNPYFEGTDVKHGAYVVEVIEGLPAAKAGIQVADVIVAVDGEDVTMELDLRNRIYFHKPGDQVTLDVLRNGEMMQLEVVLRVAR